MADHMPDLPLEIGTPVIVDRGSKFGLPEMPGHVHGYGWTRRGTAVEPYYLIHLERPVEIMGRRGYIRILTCHPDNVTLA